jgi:hypothetical protein
LFVWWLFCVCLLMGILTLSIFISSRGSQQEVQSLVKYLPLVPLAVSVGVRFGLIPRLKTRARVFPFYILSIGMADACAILGLFVVPSMRETYVVLGVLGLLLAAPWYAQRLPE